MPLVSRGHPLAHPVANCDDLATYTAQAKSRLAWTASASDAEIEAWYRRVVAALDEKTGERLAAVRSLESALAASGGALGRLARVALVGSADLLLAVAVQTRNPSLIGSAVGVDIVVDTTELAIQLISSDSSSSALEAVVVFIEGRATLVLTLLSGPGKTFGERQVEVAKAITDAMFSLGEATMDEQRLKKDLSAARRSLEALKSQSAGLPVNLSETRRFMRDRLEAEIRLYDLLRNGYSSQGCRFDHHGRA